MLAGLYLWGHERHPHRGLRGVSECTQPHLQRRLQRGTQADAAGCAKDVNFSRHLNKKRGFSLWLPSKNTFKRGTLKERQTQMEQLKQGSGWPTGVQERIDGVLFHFDSCTAPVCFCWGVALSCVVFEGKREEHHHAFSFCFCLFVCFCGKRGSRHDPPILAILSPICSKRTSQVAAASKQLTLRAVDHTFANSAIRCC